MFRLLSFFGLGLEQKKRAELLFVAAGWYRYRHAPIAGGGGFLVLLATLYPEGPGEEYVYGRVVGSPLLPLGPPQWMR